MIKKFIDNSDNSDGINIIKPNIASNIFQICMVLNLPKNIYSLYIMIENTI